MFDKPTMKLQPFSQLLVDTIRDVVYTVVILFCIKSTASKGRPEGFQRAIGKPLGRARRRETSALGEAIVLSENSITPSGRKKQ